MENINNIEQKCCSTHWHRWFKVLILLAVTAIVIVSVVMALRKQDAPNQFTASATGRVFAKPDIANIMIGLKTEAKKTAAEAVKENTNKMNEVTAELKKLGIEERDIKTTNYSLNPFYDWKDGVQALKGYEVYQNLTVKVRDLNKIGEVIAKTTEKGANQVGGINFTIDDPDELRNQARAEAIAKAKAKGLKIAEIAGLKLKEVVNVYENNVQYPEMYYGKDMALGLGGGGGVPSPEISAGENEVVVEVTVAWKVK